MKIGTVCFFRDDNKVLLLLIDYPDGVKRWNGIGGIVNNNETPEDALTREIKEEIGLIVDKTLLKKVKAINYIKKNLHLIIYISNYKPETIRLTDPSLKEFRWFDFDKIPYENMWPDNKKWLPNILI